jgi:hypothetical protein
MYHYDAFISYNHNPRDNRVTRSLQHRLENYRLPKEVVTSSGKDRIERVFLDKGELEVAGDLNTIIQDALENSDRLIVICSPESKNSIWVRREIEFFLRNHSLDDILTVITDGEPFDVLPDAVLYEEKDDGSGNTVRVPREPLSCDYRLPQRKADREELPRLIAAILGCRYDDLVQRQKQYRMRRQVALLASAAVILSSAVGYLIWSNQKIRSNYEQSLREESLNLAVHSEQALKRGDRIGAIRLALDALPSESKKRPVVSSAVLALSDALNLYHSSEESKWTAVRQYDSNVSCYDALPFTIDGTEYVAARFDGGKLKIWNAASGSELMSGYTEKLSGSDKEINDMQVADDGTLFLISDSYLYALDVPAGKEKYSLELTVPSKKGVTSSTTYGSCLSGNDLWIVAYDNTDNTRSLLHVDAKKGAVTGDIPAGEYYPELIDVSSDGRYLAYVHEANKFSEDRLEMYDTETGEKTSLTRPRITDIRFDTGGRLIMCGCSVRPSEYDYSTVPSSDYIILGKEYMYSFTQYADRELFITCLESPSLSEVWSRDISGYYCGMPALGDADDSDAGDILCTTGSSLMIMTGDGGIKGQAEFRSPVMFRSYDEKSGNVRAILKDGCFAFYDTEEKSLTTYENVYVEDIRNVRTDTDSPSGCIYVLADNNADSAKRTLTQYEYKGTDPEWKKFGQEIEYDDMASVYGMSSYGDCFIEVRSADDHDGVARVITRKAENGDIVLDKTVPVPDNAGEFSSFKYSGIDPGSGDIWFLDTLANDEPAILRVSSSTGESVYTPLAPADGSSEQVIYSSFDLKSDLGGPVVSDSADGKLYCPLLRSAKYEDAETGERKDSKSLDIMTIDAEAGTYSLATVLEIAPEDDFSLYDLSMAIDAKQKLLVTADSSNVMRAYGFDGALKWETEPLGYAVQTMCFEDDGLILTGEQMERSRFVLHMTDPAGGKETASVDLGLLHDIGSSSVFYSFCEPVSSGESLLVWENYAFILDHSDHSLRSRIRSFLAYNAGSELLILGNEGIIGSKVTGCVPYRTLEEIIAEGRAVVGEE